ncbi:MAG: homoserine dehydrogenase [Lachnospiraceae bacterium]|nr:homoserine dehydrogenase [Lachnospiraceae bacterium]
MSKVAVLGYGTVGSGVVEVIEKNQDIVSRNAGEAVTVKYVLDLRDFPGDPIQDRVVHDVNVILEDPEISVVCETMGGNEPAYTFSKKALEAGKSVCTSNKELVANHGPELIRIAKEHNCNYFFEASVGGGIPIIRPLIEALTAEHVMEISGIVNGTTNYILTKMTEEGADFDATLKDAQEKGYAERNPEADIEGYDARRKIAILSSLMSGKTVKDGEVYTEGISKITGEDIRYAAELHKTIKLLARSKQTESGYEVMVAPFLVGKESPLFPVSGVFNAIMVEGNMLGQSMFYGQGAGKLATASAVVADVIEATKNAGKHVDIFWSEEETKLAGVDSVKNAFLVRVKNETPQEEVTKLFGEPEVLIENLVEGEYGFVTGSISEAEFTGKYETLSGAMGRIRMM